MDKAKINTVIFAIIGAVATYYINHTMGYGAIIANGLVGVTGAVLLSGPLSVAVFVASFVGMSGAAVIPSIAWAAVGGCVCGFILAFTSEIYAGIGGKGGTTAALSVQITRAIVNLFI